MGTMGGGGLSRIELTAGGDVDAWAASANGLYLPHDVGLGSMSDFECDISCLEGLLGTSEDRMGIGDVLIAICVVETDSTWGAIEATFLQNGPKKKQG
jgi:hypothetical protein